jgi:hypothetical protein
MTYHASQTVRLTTPGGLNPAPRVHEMRDDGRPLCGTPARELKGTQVVYTPQGPGDVTCLRCARSQSEALGATEYPELSVVRRFRGARRRWCSTDAAGAVPGVKAGR